MHSLHHSLSPCRVPSLHSTLYHMMLQCPGLFSVYAGAMDPGHTALHGMPAAAEMCLHMQGRLWGEDSPSRDTRSEEKVPTEKYCLVVLQQSAETCVKEHQHCSFPGVTVSLELYSHEVQQQSWSCDWEQL